MNQFSLHVSVFGRTVLLTPRGDLGPRAVPELDARLDALPDGVDTLILDGRCVPFVATGDLPFFQRVLAYAVAHRTHLAPVGWRSQPLGVMTAAGVRHIPDVPPSDPGRHAAAVVGRQLEARAVAHRARGALNAHAAHPPCRD